MVPRAVEEEDRLLLPIGIFSIELHHQVPHEDEHHVAVGVGVRQREVDSAVGVERSNQRQPRIHGSLNHRSGSIARAPHLPREVRLVQPRFVDVDTPVLAAQELQHLEGILLSKYEAALGVALDRHLLGYPVSESEFRLQNAADLGQGELDIMEMIDFLLNLGRIRDWN